MRVFIMWSGEKSRRIATKLREFLRVVVPRPQYFVSTDNIQPGWIWENIIAGELATTHFGIVCLEKESLESLWIHFEAGAISKVSEYSCVIPYLIDLMPSEVSGPLTKFQSIPANKEGTFTLVESINSTLESSDRTDDDVLRTAFEGMWPNLEKVISESTLSKNENGLKTRSIDDILREILIRIRSIEKQIGDVSNATIDSNRKSLQIEEKYIQAARNYAFEKAESSGWSRPGMCFAEEDLATYTLVPPELTYFVLDSLREAGLVICVNWKCKPTWMAVQKKRSEINCES